VQIYQNVVNAAYFTIIRLYDYTITTCRKTALCKVEDMNVLLLSPVGVLSGARILVRLPKVLRHNVTKDVETAFLESVDKVDD